MARTEAMTQIQLGDGKMLDLPTQKNEIRQAALARRDALSPEWRAVASADAARRAADKVAQRAAIVAGFLPIRSEIDAQPLMLELATRGMRLCLPCIVDAETIVFRAWTQGEPLQEMKLATRGPLDSAEEVSPDVIMMPLAAFDSMGNRLGYGGGFYDRAVARQIALGIHPSLIGMAFACQEVEHIPAESHDVPMSSVITETGFRGF